MTEQEFLRERSRRVYKDAKRSVFSSTRSTAIAYLMRAADRFRLWGCIEDEGTALSFVAVLRAMLQAETIEDMVLRGELAD